MSLVTCEGLALAFGATTIFHDVSLRLEARERLAVVGANGAGKTSLLNVLAGLQQPSAGVVERARRLGIGYLPQEAPPPVAATVLDEAIASRQDIIELREELHALEQAMSRHHGDVDAQLQRYGDVQHAYQDKG